MFSSVSGLTEPSLSRLFAASAEAPREAAAGKAPAADPARARAPLDWGVLDQLGRATDPQHPEVRRQAGSRLMSELFFKPLLAQMRDFPLGKELATGGFGESAFAAQLDERLADRIAGSMPFLVDQVVGDLEPRASTSASASPPARRSAQRAKQSPRGSAGQGAGREWMA